MRLLITISIFAIQIFLLINGIAFFNRLTNPFVLAAVSLAIPLLYTIFYNRVEIVQKKTKYNSIGFAIGLLSVALCIPAINNIFRSIPDPSTGSDIIPQLETLFKRFASGIFPYAPLSQYPWHPYPVYMPLNWLPLGFAYLLHIDVRWIGIAVFAVACGFWGLYVWKINTNVLQKVVAIFLPATILYAYSKWDIFAIGVSYEMLIAGYYLILAIGLASRNLWVTTAGIILCLLSRYTLVFWLPLFLILLWVNVPAKKNFFVWLGIIVSLLVFYLIPFYFQDPSILSKGIAYHNACYVNEWNGLGNPDNSTAFDSGLNFSYFICHALSGDMERRVFWARIVQGIVMLLTFAGGLLLYKRLKDKVNFYDFCLMMLYCFLLLFYLFSPLTYKIYYISMQVVAAVLCGQIIIRVRKLNS